MMMQMFLAARSRPSRLRETIRVRENFQSAATDYFVAVAATAAAVFVRWLVAPLAATFCR